MIRRLPSLLICLLAAYISFRSIKSVLELIPPQYTGVNTHFNITLIKVVASDLTLIAILLSLCKIRFNGASRALFGGTALFTLTSMIGFYAQLYAASGLACPSCQKDYVMSGADYLYFSVITMTTVGYGDFVPADTYSRIIAATQALMGYFVLGISITAMTQPPSK